MQKGGGVKFDLHPWVLRCILKLEIKFCVQITNTVFYIEGKAALGPFFPLWAPFHIKAEAAVCHLGCSPGLSVMSLRQVTLHPDISYIYPLDDFVLCFCVGVHLNNIPTQTRILPSLCPKLLSETGPECQGEILSTEKWRQTGKVSWG